MANKNTKARNAAYRKAHKKSGFPVSVHKAKAKPFPEPNKTEDMGMRTQHLLFHGRYSKWNN